MIMRKNTYAMLDVAKWLCALLILFYHYFSEHGPIPGLLEESLSLYAVGVALFMIISGFLTYSKLEGKEYKDRKIYVFKQVKRIFKIYILWSIPYIIYTIYRWDFSELTVKFVFWEIQRWIFSQTFYTIWFMPALAIGLIVSFFVTEKFPKAVSLGLAAVMYALGSIGLTYSFAGDLIPGFETFMSFAGRWLGGTRGWLFFGFPLITMGKLAVEYKEKFNWKIMAPLSCVSVFGILCEALILRNLVGHTGIDMTVMMIPSVFCILGFLISIKAETTAATVWMRKMSVLIFMSQRIFLTVIPHLLPEKINEYIKQ